MYILNTHIHGHTCTYRCSVTAKLSEDSPLEWNEVIAAVVSVSDGQLWLGTDVGLFALVQRDNQITLRNISSVEGELTTLAWRSALADREKHVNKYAFLLKPGITKMPRQLLLHSDGSGVHVHHTSREQSRTFRKASFGLLVVGTKERIYFHDGVMWWFEWVSGWYNGNGGVIDGSPSALSFTSTGSLFIGNNVSLTQLHINYTFSRLGPLQGLPYNQIQSLYHSPYNAHRPPALLHFESDYAPGSDGSLWVGTEKGFALYDMSEQKFQHYFYGNRWHPGEAVLGFAGTGSNATVVLTDGGIAVVYPQLWTLAEKAEHYHTILERHIRPPGMSSVHECVDGCVLGF